MPGERDLKKGQIVRLKSGGPSMTVKAPITQGGVLCVWFAGKKLESAYFDLDTLDVAEDGQEESETR
jgi:uncharacterized protein YodC (DUF2158 family)